MKTNIATTKEQSARLLQCGVSADTADMTLRTETGEVNFSRYSLETELKFYGYDDPKRHIEIVPAWSLSALLSDILPCDISDNEIDYSLFLQRQRSTDNTPTWELSYYNLEYDVTLLFVETECPIEAAIQMAEKLTIDGYKLNGTNEKEQ